ncbi:MAG TPA: nucleotidyl transferase AbiEii/AbiGii toxin family protein [Chitinophagaceae bacterium]|nr:nucleotidyl transferase AbiEii/AbiGii toxin family protein [Chitinophagaceae bacterium]
MIKEWLEEYKPANREQAEQALREIMQEIALAGLGRAGFFEKAAFYSGTALRIFYGVKRFSEDLDFSLLEVEPGFELGPYLDGVIKEFEALGIDVTIKEKLKSRKTAVDSAFLKPGTEWKEIILKEIIPQERIGMRPDIKIKIEVDTNPPLGFTTEEKLLLRPFSFYTKCFSAPDLYAGKMHALLFRKWKGRTKGRDWFDMEWYIQNNIPLNLEHLVVRSIQSGDWPKKKMSKTEFIQLLHSRIDQISIDDIKDDIVRFIPDQRPLAIWSRDYFKELIKRIRYLEK